MNNLTCPRNKACFI